MTITASMVKELRDRTGLGMMECKKALNESGWRGTNPDGRAIFEVTELSLSIKSSAFEVK